MATVGGSKVAVDVKKAAVNTKALKKRTGVTSTQLKQVIQESDLHIVAGCFDNYNIYLDKLVQDETKHTDIRRTEMLEESAQSAMREVLRLWRRRIPGAATYRALLEATLELGQGDSAQRLCRHVASALSSVNRDSGDSDSDVSIGTDENDAKGSSDSSTDSHNMYMSVDTESPISGTRTETMAERDLEHETAEMRMTFAGLVTNVAMAMARRGTTPQEFALFLSQIIAVDAELTGTKQSRLLFNKQFIERVKDCSTVGEVFEMLNGYYSWFNHLLIIKIIEAFCNQDRDIARRLQEYNARLKRYCKNRLCRVPRNGFNIFRRDCQQVVFKVDGKWDSMRVEAIDRVTATIARILKLRRVALYLRTVSKGCVELTYDIPKSLDVSVDKAQILALHEQGIQYLSNIGDTKSALTHTKSIPDRTRTLKEDSRLYSLIMALCLVLCVVKLALDHKKLWGSFSDVFTYGIVLIGLITATILIIWKDMLTLAVGITFIVLAQYFGDFFLFALAALVHAVLVVSAYLALAVSGGLCVFIIGSIAHTLLCRLRATNWRIFSMKMCRTAGAALLLALLSVLLLYIDYGIEKLVNMYIYRNVVF